MKNKCFKHILSCMVMVSILLTYTKNLMAFKPEVHERITEEAVLQNKANLSNYITGYTGLKGFKEKVGGHEILGNIMDSNSMEDLVPGDFIHSHFYNPLTNLAFTSWPASLTPSAYDRANARSNQFSWSEARHYFYNGLTFKYEANRSDEFYKAFEALGHVVHLIQDVAVPAHTRLDRHGFLESFEWYTYDKISDLVYDQVPYRGSTLASMISLAPRQLWDGDFYTETSLPVGSNTVGLAEYSAANFFSEGTIFEGQPRPMLSDTDCANKVMNPTLASIVQVPDGLGGFDNGMYISKIVGDQVNYLAAFSLLKNATVLKGKSKGLGGSDICQRLAFTLNLKDKLIQQDYAATLVPRAVGYTAALMDHFFKSQIEISLPDDGVYAFVMNNGSTYPYSNMKFTQISLKVKNILPNGEDMENGDITLIVTYRVAQADSFAPGKVNVSNEVHHSIVTNTDVTIYNGDARDITFDLTSSLTTNKSIPILATDVYLQIAYKGKIGGRSDEVAFGYKDISEPTPVDFFNNMDKICLYNNWYDAGTPQTLAFVGPDGNHIANLADLYAHDAANIYLRYSSLGRPLPASNLTTIANINAGAFKRALYILTDYEFNYGVNFAGVKTDDTDTLFGHSSKDYLLTGIAIKRQTEFYGCDDKDLDNCYIQREPGFYKFRGVYLWGGAGGIFLNEVYPAGSVCQYSQLNPPSPSTPATEQYQPHEGGTVSEPVYVEPRFITLSR